jgi:hypothetical protein
MYLREQRCGLSFTKNKVKTLKTNFCDNRGAHFWHVPSQRFLLCVNYFQEVFGLGKRWVEREKRKVAPGFFFEPPLFQWPIPIKSC